MKKNYVSPVVRVIDVETSWVIAASAPAYRGSLGGSKENEQPNDRSNWGSLWQ